MNKKSLLEMSHGGFLEIFDHEMAKVFDNILDPNTKATSKRRITITMELTPDETRQKFAASFTTKLALAPPTPVTTYLYIMRDADGEACAVEAAPQVPGQMALTGGEQESPPQLRIIRNA